MLLKPFPVNRPLNQTTGWTQAHTYFTIMGGFVETRDGEEHLLSLDEIEKLTPETNPELLAPIYNSASQPPSRTPPAEAPDRVISNQHTSPIVTSLTNSPPAEKACQQASSSDSLSPNSSTESASPQYRILVAHSIIADKSKTNAPAKLITVAQTTWFIIQFIERWATHKHRTQLEVMTMAYAVLNVIVYALWWNKPYNVNEPINVSNRAHDCFRNRTMGILGNRPIVDDVFKHTKFWFVVDRSMGFSVLILVGGLFGGLHCFGWWFHFPTEQEAILWRVCAVYCTVRTSRTSSYRRARSTVGEAWGATHR